MDDAMQQQQDAGKAPVLATLKFCSTSNRTVRGPFFSRCHLPTS